MLTVLIRGCTQMPQKLDRVVNHMHIIMYSIYTDLIRLANSKLTDNFLLVARNNLHLQLFNCCKYFFSKLYNKIQSISPGLLHVNTLNQNLLVQIDNCSSSSLVYLIFMQLIA